MRQFTKEQAIDFILEQNLPCVFIDTCTLLDILRIPFREISSSNYYDLENLKRISNSQIHIFISELNYREYNENIGNVKIELDRHIKKLKMDLIKIESSALFIGKGNDLCFREIDSYNIPEQIEKKINSFLESCNIIKIDNASEIEGSRRAINKTPPSKNGKINDSIFYTSYLNIWKELTNKKFKENIIFTTSNSKDFGKTNDIQNPIKHELEDNNIQYLNTLTWCYSELKMRYINRVAGEF